MRIEEFDTAEKMVGGEAAICVCPTQHPHEIGLGIIANCDAWARVWIIVQQHLFQLGPGLVDNPTCQVIGGQCALVVLLFKFLL